ncbi:Ubiquitin hydrolase [Echinococcus granulosus]|uniref:ubiquitinyl hydrolase 1 n=1 Tax=Echinococcus granulosus TaxID=6210 RepID=W6UIU1_ECHGR|nr:Ubiquitin hydrolase [Echinococcus granulosus]EUB61430.1 Ubiquitin hydrolase [Echinococcus granulosus]
MPIFKGMWILRCDWNLVNVKWNSQKFNDVEVNTDSPPEDFKALLFSLTGVPPERQKVMMPGGLLGDTSYGQIKLRNSAFPQFATRANAEASTSEGNVEPIYQQQDANECWVEIIRVLQQLSADAKVMTSSPTDVKFPLSLDLFEFCTKELQAKLLPQREKARAEDDAEAMAAKSRKITNASKQEKPPNPEDNPELYDPYWLGDDLGSNNTGFYELQGVVSHQGRMSMGHYVAWVKRKGKWFKLDDTKVSEVDEEDILKLSGGGEYHSAYILLYGPRRVKKVIPETSMDVHLAS